ncbi:DUF4249 family protein [Flavobacterium sp. H122]|uniref:DUF4249 family protein n=1 Tax=Flavobacterium sp. H122 TaxID=2529860 RepID=UPI0010AB2B74|nr:DUF4249 family protein [Flavobacterium sp. H122]
MKVISKYLSIIATFLLLSGCEEVIDVPLENAKPKLVIEANIKWQLGTDGNLQTVKLSLTNDFYTSDILPANGAIVTITDAANTIFNFIQTPNTPNYICGNFSPLVNETYTLKVIYNGETYSSTAKLLPTPPIVDIQQETVKGIGGKDEIHIKYFFQDDENEVNYYLLRVDNPKIKYAEYGSVSDEFFQGNLMFGFYPNEVIKGNTLKLGVQCVTLSHYNFMNKLINISSQNSGNPFATPPATLRGNIVNQTNPDNFPYGSFNLSESDTKEYTVQ